VHADATSAEFSPNTGTPIIIFMPEISRTHMGGTMRLGLRPTVFETGSENWSKVWKLYGGKGKIWERHRHRYEVNPEHVDRLEHSGLTFIGKDEKGERMQILELQGVSDLDLAIQLRMLSSSGSSSRSSFLRWLTGSPRILHSSSQSIPSFPRTPCCGI